MKAILCCICLLVLASIPLWGEICWDEPLDLITMNNLHFEGTGIRTSDNCVILYWVEGAGDDRKGYLQKYNAAIQADWTTPIEFLLPMYKTTLMETITGNIILGGLGSLTGASAYNITKIDINGNLLWNPGTLIAGYNSSFTQSNNRIVLKPDNSDGFYISCSDINDQSIYLQHITAAGERLLGLNCLALTTSYDIDTDHDMVVLPDNDIVITYCKDYLTTVQRRNPDGTVEWTQTISQPENLSLYIRPRVLLTSPETIEVVTYSYYCITVSKWTDGGEQSWPQPVILSQNTTTLVNAFKHGEVINNDGSVIYTWIWHDTIFSCKLDADGQQVWTENVEIETTTDEYYDIKAVSDGVGGSYLVFSNATSDNHIVYRVQHVSTIGNVLSSPVSVYNSVEDHGESMGLSVLAINGNVILNFSGLDQQISGIRAQSLNQQGNTLLGQTAILVHGGNYGWIHDPVLLARNNDFIDIWLCSDSPGETHDFAIAYKILTPNGSVVGNETNIITNTYQIHAMDAVVSDDSRTLIAWTETNQGYHLKVQMVYPNGSILWGYGGMTITTNSSGLTNVSVSYDNGIFYVVWTSLNPNGYVRIYGQKIVDGETQWGNGIQIVADDPGYLDKNYQMGSLNGRYITFSIQATHITARVLNFMENGQPSSGYNGYGNSIGSLPEGNFRQSVHKSYLYQESLIITYSNIETDWNEVHGSYDTYYPKIQIFGPGGVQELGPDGQEWGGINSTFILQDGIYVMSAYSDLILRKYNSDLTLQWQNTQDVSGEWVDLDLNRLPDQRLLITGKFLQGGDTKVGHLYYLENEAVFHLPDDYIIAVDNSWYDIQTAVLNDQAFVQWTSDYFDRLRIQKVNNGSVSVDDDTSNQTSTIEIQSNYPNPFSQTTNIKVSLKDDIRCKVIVYNTKGQKVKTLYNGLMTKGINQITWDGNDNENHQVSNGVYLIRVSDEKHFITKRVSKLR